MQFPARIAPTPASAARLPGLLPSLLVLLPLGRCGDPD
jgi:hypothetical protein